MTARFGMYGKIVAQPGKRAALVAALLDAAALIEDAPGCELYVVNESPSEPDAIWVTEVWRSRADHEASLRIDAVRELIGRTMPLIAEAASQRIELVPIGGLGLEPTA